jgi:hypothetical protein
MAVNALEECQRELTMLLLTVMSLHAMYHTLREFCSLIGSLLLPRPAPWAPEAGGSIAEVQSWRQATRVTKRQSREDATHTRPH